MFRIPMIALAGVLLALVVAACGSDKASNSGRNAGEDGATVTTNPTPGAQTSTQGGGRKTGAVVSVGIKDIKFMPKKITVKVGQKIVWTNHDDGIPHNVTATDGANFASDTLQKNSTFDYTPTKVGTIKYVCTIHSGQNGEIDVTK
jgi:plastocyanin